MRPLSAILHEKRLNLDNTQKAIIASIEIAATPEMAYDLTSGSRNATAASKELIRAGYIRVNNTLKQAELTPLGKEVLTSDNLIQDGRLTDRGEELTDRYIRDRNEWKKFESFKYVNSV
jgi:Mn-dependent DtxR family transcriptional regulator